MRQREGPGLRGLMGRGPAYAYAGKLDELGLALGRNGKVGGRVSKEMRERGKGRGSYLRTTAAVKKRFFAIGAAFLPHADAIGHFADVLVEAVRASEFIEETATGLSVSRRRRAGRSRPARWSARPGRGGAASHHRLAPRPGPLGRPSAGSDRAVFTPAGLAIATGGSPPLWHCGRWNPSRNVDAIAEAAARFGATSANRLTWPGAD